MDMNIICSSGPSTFEYEVFRQMADNGMDAMRINLSHCFAHEINSVIENCIRIKRDQNKEIQILYDTRGPELRIKSLGKYNLVKGQRVLISNTHMDNTTFSLELNDFRNFFELNRYIEVNDGKLTLRIVNVTESEIECIAINDGIIKNNHGLNYDDIHSRIPYFSENDKRDILEALKHPVDWFALSFANSAENIQEVKSFISRNSKKSVKIMAKIETKEAIKNLSGIIAVSDAIMVARGDLKACVGTETLPYFQKLIIDTSVSYGKPVIVATGLLNSMRENPNPTLSESSDLFKAIADGADGVMFCSETSVGKYPVETVSYAKRIIDTARHYVK